jgi:hypothetical protein
MKPNPNAALEMEAANSATNWTLGCVEYLTLQISNIPFKVHAHVIEDAPFRVLLGHPFQCVVLSILEDRPDGRVDLTIRNPHRARRLTVTARERHVQVRYVHILAYQCSPPPRMNALKHYVSNTVPPTPVLAYKKAVKKVHPVAASLPEDFHVIQRRPKDPLISLPPLPTHPPPFTPGLRLMQECLDDLELNKYDFLWPDELKLAQHILKLNEKALAWTEAERGRFHDEYFSLVKIPTIAHTLWVHKNIPIPTGILDDVINLFKKKIAACMYEPSDASYRSHWFYIPKKNGKLRIVHDLQPLNAITIRNAAVPPFVDQFVEGMAAHACYSMLDLFVSYDHCTLDISSCDLTTFQTPLGAYRCSAPTGLN